MAERLLLTGASGFVGQPLLRALLADGWEVHAVARQAPSVGAGGAGGEPAPGLHWHPVDLLRTTEAQALLRELRPSHLLHAAWYVAHGRFWQAPENQDWLAASTALGEAFFAQGGQRLMGLGSCAEYAQWVDPLSDAQPWTEDRPLQPGTPYGQAKAELWRRWRALAAGQPGAQAVWARLFLMFGPGEQPQRLVPSVASALLAGQPALCGSGAPLRDFASTPWLAQALSALLRSPVQGAVNVASGQGHSIASVARCLAELAGAPGLLRLGALADRPDEVPAMVADTRRLREEVGHHTPFDLQSALQRCLSDWR